MSRLEAGRVRIVAEGAKFVAFAGAVLEFVGHFNWFKVSLCDFFLVHTRQDFVLSCVGVL